MKSYPPRADRRARHVRVPAFSPVPLRSRADGWAPARQAVFLGVLAETGSVAQAARRVGMARETAYRLRRKPGAESFAAAWDKVTGRVTDPRRKVTPAERARRALQGLLKPRIYQGRYVGTEHKADNSALLGHTAGLYRADRMGRRDGERSQGFTGRFVSTGGGGGRARVIPPATRKLIEPMDKAWPPAQGFRSGQRG